MFDFLNNLTITDVVILAILALIIIFAGIILIIFLTHKSKNKSVIDVYEENTKKKKTVDKNKKPEVKMALAAENIEAIENVISNTIKPEISKNTDTETKEKVEIKEEKIEKRDDDMDQELKQAEQDRRTKTSIDDVLKAMQIDLEKRKYAKIDSYEEEQEKEAVISYQELKQKMSSKVNQDLNSNVLEEEKLFDDNTNDYKNAFFDILDRNESEQSVLAPSDETILFDKEIILPEEEIIEEDYSYDLRDTVYPRNEEAKYNKTLEHKEFISPVFGKQDVDFVYPKARENQRVEERRQPKELSSISETDEFLNTLKEFRNNL